MSWTTVPDKYIRSIVNLNPYIQNNESSKKVIAILLINQFYLSLWTIKSLIPQYYLKTMQVEQSSIRKKIASLNRSDIQAYAEVSPVV